MVTVKQLKLLCKKYKLTQGGTKKQLAKRLYNLRSDTMSKKDLKIVKDLLKVKTHKRKLKKTKKAKKAKKAGVGFSDLVTYFTDLPRQDALYRDTDNIHRNFQEERETLLEKSKTPDLAEIEAPYPREMTLDVPKVERMRPDWDIERSVQVFIPRIKEAFKNLELQHDDYDYERKLHLIIGSKYDSDDYFPYMVLDEKDSVDPDHKKLNEIFRQRGKFIHKDQLAIAHSKVESDKESDLFPKSSFSEEMKKEFKDLYDWERRFPPGDAIDRTSFFRKKVRYQPKYPTEEGIHFQYYDLFEKDFVTP
jgi:hypothetical protein